MPDADFIHSTLRERIVEHLFVGEILRALWCRDIMDVEVTRSEFDAYGYDLILSRGPVVRHVQLKTQSGGDISVALSLGRKPSGCVVWIAIDKTLRLGPFRWYGAAPGEPLPSIEGLKAPRHQRRNKQGERPVREGHRLVPKRAFVVLQTIDDVLSKLFGQLPT